MFFAKILLCVLLWLHLMDHLIKEHKTWPLLESTIEEAVERARCDTEEAGIALGQKSELTLATGKEKMEIYGLLP